MLLALACGPGEVAEPIPDPVVRIGLIAPFSGPTVEELGTPVQLGAELAIRDFEAGGGLVVEGRPVSIELVTEDSGDRPEQAMWAARKLITRDEVVALLGPVLSRNALVAATVAEFHRVPMITPSATAPEVTADRHYVFRTTFVDDQQGRALARFVREHLDAQRVAVLFDIASTHQRTITEVFETELENRGGFLVAAESFTTGEQDFRPQLRRILATDPEVLFLPNYLEEVPLQVVQAREIGLTATFLGSDAWSGTAYPALPGFEGAYFADEWQVAVEATTTEVSRDFEQRYLETFGHPPQSLAAVSYDTCNLLLAAMAQSPTLDGEVLRDNLLALPEMAGVTGSMDFLQDGDPRKSVYVYQIVDGKLDLEVILPPD